MLLYIGCMAITIECEIKINHLNGRICMYWTLDGSKGKIRDLNQEPRILA